MWITAFKNGFWGLKMSRPRRCGIINQSVNEGENTKFYNFISPFMALATAKLDFAMICRDSFVTSGSACTSLSLFACSLSSRRMSLPCAADAGGKLSLQTATMLDTIVMI